jgi:FkbH-like protein
VRACASNAAPGLLKRGALSTIPTARTATVAPAPWEFAIGATFTAEPLGPVLAFWGRRFGSEFQIRFAPYNQPLQTLLDPASVFARNSHGVNAFLLRLEDLAQFGDENGSFAKLEANLHEITEAARATVERFSVPVIVCLCPPSPAFMALPGAADFCRKAAAWMEPNLSGLHFIHFEQIQRLYPVEGIHNPSGEQLGRIPYTELYYAALGTMLVRYAHAVLSPPYKVIALDCDNTLWEGICGEDGPAGVRLDPARRRIQEFMLEQRESGMLLCLASKNNEQDVFDTFAQNPAMPLQLRHLVSWKLNWLSKAENLSTLAADLGVGLDSFLFIDDNPKECAEVENALPEVLTVPLPAEISEAPRLLEHIWAFDHPVLTEEDRRRSAYYQQAQEFGREMRKTPDLRDFKASLNLKVNIEPLAPSRLARVAQLTQRTNQFNCTTIRRTAPEIQALTCEGGLECFTAEVSDRFGDYGLVGTVILKPEPNRIVVDTFLLSCRALGRGVEHRILAWLGEEAIRRGLELVEVRFEATAKNRPALDFLQSVSRELGHRSAEMSFLFAAEGLRRLEWNPEEPATAAPVTPKARTGQSRPAPEFALIARQLSTPEAILAAVRRENVQNANLGAASNPPRTEVERELAIIWTELLQVPSISRTDNFFDLGGHSLLAVLLLLRIKEALGVEVSIDDVYSSSMTLESLAQRVDAIRYGQLQPEEYEALLREIESLSDSEVAELLARESLESGNS